MGANKVKWTTHDPCLVLSESVSMLCSNYEFCEKKNHRHLKNISIYEAKHFLMTKKKSKKNLHILEDGANDVQVSDIEQVIV